MPRKSLAPAAPGPLPESVAREALDLGRELTSEQAAGLAAYLRLLMDWNRRMNLVGARSWSDALARLVADSWHLADLLADMSAAGSLPPNPRCLDLGAGAGLPGIPLRLFWPHGDYLLVEPRHKRSAFLRVAVATLGLMGIAVFPGRVEELPPEQLPADLVLARAFLPWPELLELAAGLLAPKGMVVAFAHDPEPDAERIPDDWRFVCGRSYSSPEGSRSFWVFTPASTPR